MVLINNTLSSSSLEAGDSADTSDVIEHDSSLSEHDSSLSLPAKRLKCETRDTFR